MLLRLASRFAVLLVSLAVASLIVFAVMAVLPGDPARVALGLNASEESVAQMREEFGLDRPWPVRYTEWVTGLLTLDLGQSYVSRAEIAPQLVDRFAVTLWLVGTAMALAVLVAVPLGAVMALRHRSGVGVVLSAASQVGMAVPATRENREYFESQREELERASKERIAAAQARKEALEDVVCEIHARASAEGSLYGSVGPQEIAARLTEMGKAVEKSEVLMPEGPIRHGGEYDIDLSLHADVDATVKLIVVAEEDPAA